MGVVLHVGSHKSRIEGENNFPSNHISLNATQDMTGFLGCKNMLPAAVQFSVHQYSMSFSTGLLSLLSLSSLCHAANICV